MMHDNISIDNETKIIFFFLLKDTKKFCFTMRRVFAKISL